MSRLSVVLLVLIAGCASVPSPTYRDFEVRTAARAADASLTTRVRRAAEAAGWTVTASSVPGVVRTEPRAVPGGLLSRATAALEFVPLNAGPAHAPRIVRTIVHAEQRSFLGGRSKVYALDGRLRAALLAPISEALAAEGLVALGTPRDRDEDAADAP